MAVTPIGSIIHVNQNMQVIASKQTDFQARLDAQTLAAGAALDGKEKDVQEVRPTEKTHKIDPEKEHEKEKKDQEEELADNNAKKEKTTEKKDKEKKSTSSHILDIKI